jgi:hypothetical protein
VVAAANYQIRPKTWSAEPEFLPEFGIFLAESVGEQLLQTDIFFLELY